MKESLSPEHSCELLADTLEHFLDSGRVSNEGGGHLQPLGRDIAHTRLDIVGDPLHEIAAVLILNVEHLLINLQPAKLCKSCQAQAYRGLLHHKAKPGTVCEYKALNCPSSNYTTEQLTAI